MDSNENTIYTDFDLSMARNPFTNDVTPLTNVNAIKRSIRHLFMLNKYDIPFQDSGNNMLKGLLFEPISKVTQGNLYSQIEWLIRRYEPRVKVIKIDVESNEVENGYNVTIFFKIISLNSEERMDIFLQRVR